MDKELQDLAWACLPKEVRENIRNSYNDICEDNEVVVKIFLEEIYGHHNLTSDTEPDEMLMVERKKVIDLYATMDKAFPREAAYSVQSALQTLFGDKCLPDKELNEENFAKSELEHRLEQTSVQVEPKFRKGDKVCFKDSYYKEELHGEIGIIVSVNAESECYVEVDNTVYCARESDLEPYTEPETKDSIASKPEAKEEAKELNLCELLKDCEEEKFFSLMFGDVTFVKVIEKPNLEFGEKPIATSEGRYLPNAMYGLDGVPTLFPSRALYEKYPLDAYSAWMEWKESRKPKRWRAKKGESYWNIVFDKDFDNYILDSVDVRDSIDDACYEVGNYFRTEEEALQAVEIVKETLDKFHKQNAK